MTLTNALRFGPRGAKGGIVGIALGALVVAAVSATGASVLLATSSLAFNVLKLVGAAYLCYLGIRMWRIPPTTPALPAAHEAGFGRQLIEGALLQLTNPKVVFFFLSVFPQFIDLRAGHVSQFAALVLTYSALVVAIHSAYARFAGAARRWLVSERGGRIMNRAAGAMFICFGAALATAKR